ncbi:MAG TPA: hypothetical protein VF116_05345 [Ktedonobacterales bacterium]
MSADFRITARDGAPVALVEIKNRQNLSPDVAIQYRRNLLVHGALPRSSFFLLLSQDRGYIWKDASATDLDAAPTQTFPMSHVVERYSLIPSDGRLTGTAFALLVLPWLNDLSSGRRDDCQEPETSLAQTGFLDAIRGGHVELGVAA